MYETNKESEVLEKGTVVYWYGIPGTGTGISLYQFSVPFKMTQEWVKLITQQEKTYQQYMFFPRQLKLLGLDPLHCYKKPTCVHIL